MPAKTAKTAKPQGTETTRFWLLAALVVAITVGVGLMTTGGDESATEQKVEQTPADDEVLVVNPMIPSGKIAAASWRDRPVEDSTDLEASASHLDDLDTDPFGKGAEKKKRAEESLKETVDRIHGLGVYVEPAKEDDK